MSLTMHYAQYTMHYAPYTMHEDGSRWAWQPWQAETAVRGTGTTSRSSREQYRSTPISGFVGQVQSWGRREGVKAFYCWAIYLPSQIYRTYFK